LPVHDYLVKGDVTIKGPGCISTGGPELKRTAVFVGPLENPAGPLGDGSTGGPEGGNTCPGSITGGPLNSFGAPPAGSITGGPLIWLRTALARLIPGVFPITGGPLRNFSGVKNPVGSGGLGYAKFHGNWLLIQGIVASYFKPPTIKERTFLALAIVCPIS
jgi:hypothetical protein